MRTVTLLLCAAALPGQAALADPERAELEALLRQSQQRWDLAAPRGLFARKPATTVRYLAGRLDDGTQVPGLLSESQTYTICGNALSLLETLTSVRVCGRGRRYLGFATHDHRHEVPSRQLTEAWRQWLRVRRDVPEAAWFWGLSGAELQSIQGPILKRPDAWTPKDLARVRVLGRRAHPFLLSRLEDDQWAVEGRRYCDQADGLLATLTGSEPVGIPRGNPLELNQQDPRRRDHLVQVENRAGMRFARETWTVRLLGR